MPFLTVGAPSAPLSNLQLIIHFFGSFFFPPPTRAEFTSNEMPKSLALLDKGMCRDFAKRVFRLWDKENRIAHEGFDLSLVKDGDTIQVRSDDENRMFVYT